MATLERPYMLRVRMTDGERRMLETLAERQGLTASDLVRQLVRREHQTQGEAESTAQRRKR